MTKPALHDWIPLVERELHRVAEKYLRGERSGHTLQPTALVNEAYLALMNRKDVAWESRGHVLAVAALTMRQILVDHARRHRAEKRGGGALRVTLDEQQLANDESAPELLALDEALLLLASQNERQAKIVELRYFGGLGIEETAEALGISPRTVKRDWVAARAWLYRRLQEARRA